MWDNNGMEVQVVKEFTQNRTEIEVYWIHCMRAAGRTPRKRLQEAVEGGGAVFKAEDKKVWDRMELSFCGTCAWL